jgi:hypothetical protein
MHKKNLIIIVLIIIVLLIGVIFHNKYRANKAVTLDENRQQAIEDIIQKSDITINTKYQYRDGVHTFLGTFETPSPCYSYNVVEKEKDGIKEIAITYQQPHDESGEAVFCPQVITERQFKILIEGDIDDQIIATLNGEVVNLNIFEVGEDENIEDVEIYIKG